MDTVVAVELYTAEHRFRKPFSTSGWTVESRRVLYLLLKDSVGRTGIGEAAPLESFGTEPFDACALTLKRHAPTLVGCPLSRDSFAAAFSSRLSDMSAPTARFAMETALLDLLGRQSGLSLSSLLGGEVSENRILVNTVIPAGPVSDTARAAREAARSGYTCIKLKVGGGTIGDDVQRLEAVRDAVGDDVLIRLDANGAWDRETALDALDRFVPFDVEYVEQPVPPTNIEDLAFLKEHSPLAIAADESIASIAEARMLLAADACDVFILKPMALGSMLECRRFAEEARVCWKKTVFTSLLDSSVGRHAVAHLAASLPQVTQHHHGLGTGSLLVTDVHGDDIHGGMFMLPDGSGLGIEPDLSIATRVTVYPS